MEPGYIDCMDNTERYEGKTVEFTAMVLKSEKLPKNYFVPGRMAMTRYEADMTFLGIYLQGQGSQIVRETRQWFM